MLQSVLGLSKVLSHLLGKLTSSFKIVVLKCPLEKVEDEIVVLRALIVENLSDFCEFRHVHHSVGAHGHQLKQDVEHVIVSVEPLLDLLKHSKNLLIRPPQVIIFVNTNGSEDSKLNHLFRPDLVCTSVYLFLAYSECSLGIVHVQDFSYLLLEDGLVA